MEPLYHGNINILDQIRLSYGVDKMKAYFYDLLKKDTEKAINLINDNHLHFCSIFVLQSEIRENRLYGNLNSQLKNALYIIDGISARKNTGARSPVIANTHLSHSSIKWILETGSNDDGFSNQFDSILDSAAALLVKTFNDKAALPIISKMIFKRHSLGLFNYDLIWAFFEAHDPDSLELIADYLRSGNIKDFELACKLLSFIPYTNMGVVQHSPRLFVLCKKWLKQNLPYLYYSGDSFQQTCNPVFYLVSWEAKYLCKKVSVDTGDFLEPLTSVEENHLEDFNTQSYDSKIILAEYSSRLYQQDMNLWNNWHRYPVSDQIRLAKRIGGKLL